MTPNEFEHLCSLDQRQQTTSNIFPQKECSCFKGEHRCSNFVTTIV